MLVVASSSPEVPNLLGPDLRVHLVRRALQWRGRNLENGERWSIVRKRLSDARDAWNQWREGKRTCCASKQRTQNSIGEHDETRMWGC